MTARRLALSNVVNGGDRRASLEAIRDKLAKELSNAEGRDAAILAKELRMVIAELDSLPGGREVTKLDRLAAGVADELAAQRDRRAGRRTDTTSS